MFLLTKHLGPLVLSLNKQDVRFDNRTGKKSGEPISNSKLFALFREILLIESKRDELLSAVWSEIGSAGVNKLASALGFAPREQPNLAQPANGIINLDQTLKRFQASENTRKYFDCFPREGCRIFNSVDFPIPTGVVTPISFDSERFDPFNMHAAPNLTRITILRTGRYNVGGCVELDDAAAGYRELNVRLNGVTNIVSQNRLPIAGGINDKISTACDYEFVLNDYVELTVFQNSGGPLNAVHSNNYSAEFWCCRIHDQPV